MKLSIIIACVNEDAELNATIASIRETAGDRAEICVCDDSSAFPLQCGADVLVRNDLRIGCGPSRHVGALHASGDMLLFIDPHMRFAPGWFEEAAKVLNPADNVLWCATCVGLQTGQMDVTKVTKEYHGATFNFCGPDRHDERKMQIFEPVWLDKDRWAYHNEEIACVMGACYFIPRSLFLGLSPLRFLKSWGMDEAMLSLKVWLAGGGVRHLRTVRIGHKWRSNGERQPYAVKQGHPYYNKLFAIHTLCGKDLAQVFIEKMREHYPPPEMVKAEAMIEDNWSLVETERADNLQVFQHDLHWLAGRFGLTLPV